uniref:Protein kinase domain-containing protein n=1 Tax=Fagus sylvatica TaxID=28930 RepID=A0A2N9G9D0_FAGSY
MKSIQSSSTVNTKAFDTAASLNLTFDTTPSINLRPPPIDRHKSFDEDDFSKKPIVAKKAYAAPINVTSYSVADLQMATGSFSVENLLGEGSFGRVYRAQFDDGKLHHQNVTELVGYCSEHGQHLLVYEFHKNGSLHEFLHLSDDYNQPLTWNSRVKIALGTARALEKEISWGNLDFYRSILLLSIILVNGLPGSHEETVQALNQNAGSGYSAPEVAMSGQYNLKSDVYSFGVVMLELLSGRKPFDSSRPRSEQSLVRWATPQLHDIDALGKMADPALKGLYPVKSLSRFADVIALCVQPEPEFRPPMSEVVQALVRLVQRANMSKRTIGNDQGGSQRNLYADTNE